MCGEGASAVPGLRLALAVGAIRPFIQSHFCLVILLLLFGCICCCLREVGCFFFFCWYVTVFIVSDICLFRICIYFINLFCCCHCSASRWEMLVAAGHLGSGIFGQLE